MNKRAKDIAFLIVVIMVVSIFFFGIYNWEKYQAHYTNRIQKNLYYICVATCIYMLSFLICLMAKTFWMRVGGAILFAVFGVNLYIELCSDPQNWNEWDKAMFQIVTANFVGVLCLLELIKKKK